MRYGKLVRDKIINFLESKGLKYTCHPASEKELPKKLEEKVLEEIYELLESKNEEEFSDVKEILNEFCRFYGINEKLVESTRRKKLQERGGFEKKIILEEIIEKENELEKKCFFCEVYKDGKEIAYENNHFYSRFDRFPVSLGHSEIISKRHIEKLEELKRIEWDSLNLAIKDTTYLIENSDLKKIYINLLKNVPNKSSKNFLESAINSPFLGKKPDAYNHGINDGEAAGRTIHHLHWHIIPRYFDDVKNPQGGVRNIIPQKGLY
ncbi:MAG: HIT domain-containing protein [Nanoarchaeota archaeon]|nr:HIT domain-containing protein [Nanoarchaeota archaeon]